MIHDISLIIHVIIRDISLIIHDMGLIIHEISLIIHLDEQVITRFWSEDTINLPNISSFVV